MTRSEPFRPGSRWLITARTRAAWETILNRFDDGTWHRLEDLRQVLTETAGLAPRTIENHLRSASRRGWIHTRRGSFCLCGSDLIRAALEATQ